MGTKYALQNGSLPTEDFIPRARRGNRWNILLLRGVSLVIGVIEVYVPANIFDVIPKLRGHECAHEPFERVIGNGWRMRPLLTEPL